MGIVIPFGLNRIPVLSGFSLDGFHCISNIIIQDTLVLLNNSIFIIHVFLLTIKVIYTIILLVCIIILCQCDFHHFLPQLTDVWHCICSYGSYSVELDLHISAIVFTNQEQNFIFLSQSPAGLPKTTICLEAFQLMLCMKYSKFQ